MNPLILAATTAAILAYGTLVGFPRCQPGDPGVTIGHSMVVAGCPMVRR